MVNAAAAAAKLCVGHVGAQLVAILQAEAVDFVLARPHFIGVIPAGDEAAVVARSRPGCPAPTIVVIVAKTFEILGAIPAGGALRHVAWRFARVCGVWGWVLGMFGDGV